MNGFFDIDITYLKGVGEKRGKLLKEELGVATFRDMLFYFPFRYVDRSRFYKISELNGDSTYVQLRGKFISFSIEGEGARKRLAGLFSDGERLMQVVWFSRVNALKDLYRTGMEYVLFGKPSLYKGNLNMTHPEVTTYDPKRPPQGFQGIYNMTEKFRKSGSTRMLYTLACNLLEHPRFGEIKDTMPGAIRESYRLMGLKEALRNLHNPTDTAALQKARERMKFEELYYLQLHILRFAKSRNRRIRGHVLEKIGDKFNTFFHSCLPFDLTGAQKRVLKEIRHDMRFGRQMNRLLQGDVGSGKTMVAFMTLLMGVDNGFQGALMAPTEILATQHYETIRSWASRIGVEARLLTGTTRSKERKEIHEDLQTGKIDILIGTHALIEDGVRFRNLGITVIDEQHRFGVAQRARMWGKGTVPPHMLVMTATPIPRTLAMTLYGDLDVSVIDELPPGRKPVETWLRFDDNRTEVTRLLKRELAAGRQVYIVYPLITENPKLELKSLEEGYARVCGMFPEYKVACVHGKMKADIKEKQMGRFSSGEAQILVATTVIEVGVNVPNASVMLIENAERFGLSQLHQLRGRVGRGADRSYCILMGKRNSGGVTLKRMRIMTETSDGFQISEADMRLRGPGDMEGTQQSGLAFNLNIANLATDGQILNLARRAAAETLDALPQIYGETAGCPDTFWGTGNERRLAMDQGDSDILEEELRYRFSNKTNWSQIS